MDKYKKFGTEITINDGIILRNYCLLIPLQGGQRYWDVLGYAYWNFSWYWDLYWEFEKLQNGTGMYWGNFILIKKKIFM